MFKVFKLTNLSLINHEKQIYFYARSRGQVVRLRTILCQCALTCTVYFSILRQKDQQPTLTQTNTEENLETVYHEPFVDYLHQRLEKKFK